jgi:hypothetical protein
MMVPAILGIIVAIGLNVAFGPIMIFVFGAPCAVLAGAKVRSHVRRTAGVPAAWISNSWTLRRPMLLFDVWTIGIASAFGTFMLLDS